MTAVLHHLAPSAVVVGIDHISGLTNLSTANLGKDGLDVDQSGSKICIITGDGREGMVILDLADWQVL